MKRALIALCALLAQVPAGAQFAQVIGDEVPRDKQVMASLYAVAISKPDIQTAKAGNKADMNSLTATRGGPSAGRALGLYLGGREIVFSSEYKDLPVSMMCKFAYDLHSHVEHAGGGWANYRKALEKDASKSRSDDLQDEARRLMGEKVAEGTDKTMVSYQNQFEFGKAWWPHLYPKFKTMSADAKDRFVYESILDGTNLYDRWEARQPGVDNPAAGSIGNDADHVGFIDASLGNLADKK